MRYSLHSYAAEQPVGRRYGNVPAEEPAGDDSDS